MKRSRSTPNLLCKRDLTSDIKAKIAQGAVHPWAESSGWNQLTYDMPRKSTLENIRSKIEQGILHPSANSYKKIIKVKINKKRYPKTIYEKNWSMLMSAAMDNDHVLVKYLLQQGAATDYISPNFHTAASAAAMGGSMHILLYLLARIDLGAAVSLEVLKELPELLEPYFSTAVEYKHDTNPYYFLLCVKLLMRVLYVSIKSYSHMGEFIKGKVYKDLFCAGLKLKQPDALKLEIDDFMLSFNNKTKQLFVLEPLSSNKLAASRYARYKAATQESDNSSKENNNEAHCKI